MWFDDYAYTMDQRVRNLPNFRTRYLYDFLASWKGSLLLLPGLRGTGKTTLLLQLYKALLGRGSKAWLFWVDETKLFHDAGVKAIVRAIEEVEGDVIENVSGTLMLDEVQYDPKWDALLKIVHDRAPGLSVIATGSSMLELTSSPDLLRRAEIKRVWPLSHPEWHHLQGKTTTPVYLSQLLAGTARAPTLPGFHEFLRRGGFPFTLSGKGHLKGIVKRVIEADLPRIRNFSRKTLAAVPRILETLAQSTNINVARIAQEVGVSKPVILALIDALEQAGMIIQLRPHGNPATSIRKGYQRYFAAPSLRASFLKRRDDGLLLEDYVVAILARYCRKLGEELTYWPGEGPDVVMGNTAVEISTGKKDSRQAREALRKGVKRAVIISKDFHYRLEGDILWVPLSLFSMVA